MKRKRWNYRGDETLHASFIIIMTFVGLGSTLIVISSSVQYLAVPSSETLEGWETIGGLEYTFWNPTYGRNVTPNDTAIHTDVHPYAHYNLEYNTASEYYAFTVPYGSGPAVRVWTFRNNSDFEPGNLDWDHRDYNFFLITRQTEDWPIPNIRVATVPFETLTANQLDGNMSSSSFMLGKMNCTLFVSAVSDLTGKLYSNDNYTIRIGTELGAQLGRASMWTVLGQLLTMRLPNCHPIVQGLLAVPMWAGIGFLAVTIISRFIPFIGGG